MPRDNHLTHIQHTLNLARLSGALIRPFGMQCSAARAKLGGTNNQMLEDLEAWRRTVELIIKTPEPKPLPWGINAKQLDADYAFHLLHTDSVFQRKRATLDDFGCLEYVVSHFMNMHLVAGFYGYGVEKYATRGLYNWLYKNGALPKLYVVMGEVIQEINDHILDLKLLRTYEDMARIDRAAAERLGIEYKPETLPAFLQSTLHYPPQALAGLSVKQCLHIRRHINQQRNECVGHRLGYGWNAPPPKEKQRVNINIVH